MSKPNKGFTPVLIHGEGLLDSVTPSTFLTDPQLMEQRDKFIAGVREFSRSVGRNRLDDARATFGMGSDPSSLPGSLGHVMQALIERVSDGFTRDIAKNGDYINVHSLDSIFAGLEFRDVEGFVKGFEETLLRFYSYSELMSHTFRNVPNEVRVTKNELGRFDELSLDIRKDIGSELLAEGLTVLARMRSLGHTGDAEYDAADSPVLFYSKQTLETVFSVLDDLAKGAIPVPDGFPSAQDLIERILADPESAPSKVMDLIRNKAIVKATEQNHPALDSGSVLDPNIGTRMNTSNSPDRASVSPQPQRHLYLVRD